MLYTFAADAICDGDNVRGVTVVNKSGMTNIYAKIVIDATCHAYLGVRETRHFKGKYTLTKQDILESRQFDDYVVKDAWFNFDVYNTTGAGLDKNGMQKHFPNTKGYTIPYRCLLPVRVQNLLLCGRNISGTHIAHSSFRVMPICVGTGEAAGVAAAIAAKQDRNLNDISAAEIRELIGI